MARRSGIGVHHPGFLRYRRGLRGGLATGRAAVAHRNAAHQDLGGIVSGPAWRRDLPDQPMPGLGTIGVIPVAASYSWLTRGNARAAVAWICGVAGLLAYNWWVLVPLKPGLMSSPNELFSNLEVTGQPFATAMQHADLLAGLLLVAAFLAAGSSSIVAGRREWLGMMIFCAAGGVGGLFPEVCADEINAACMRMELHFQLPVNQYLHVVAGIIEFGGITAALLFAARRTRGDRTRIARVYRDLAVGAYVGYPVLGLAYLLNKLGGAMEAVFFTGFTVMVLTQLVERTESLRRIPLTGGRSGSAPSPRLGFQLTADRLALSCSTRSTGEVLTRRRRSQPAAAARGSQQAAAVRRPCSDSAPSGAAGGQAVRAGLRRTRRSGRGGHG